MIGNLQAATENQQYNPYTSLWVEVIKQAYLKAVAGELRSILFFQAQDGTFSELCILLNLPEQRIREQVLLNVNNRRKTNEEYLD